MSRILLGLLLLAPVTAAAGAHRFAADLAATPAQGRLISAGMGWTCEGPRCAATGEMNDTPGRFCSRLARDAGRVTQFAVDGAPLPDAALAKCNARAKAVSTAVAAN